MPIPWGRKVPGGFREQLGGLWGCTVGGGGGFAGRASEEWARLGSVTLKVMVRAVGFPSKRWEPQRVSDQGMILTDS